MTTLSTHDTKRSEDVRARLAVLSEVPPSGARPGALARRCPAHRAPARPSDRVPRLADPRRQGLAPDHGRAPARLPGEGDPRGQAAHDLDGPGGYEAAVHAFADARPRRRRARRGSPQCVERTAGRPLNSLAQKLLQLDAARRARRLPGHRARRPLPRRPRQPPPGRLPAAGGGGPSTPATPRPTSTTRSCSSPSRALRLRRERPEWFAGPDAGYAPVATATGTRSPSGGAAASVVPWPHGCPCRSRVGGWGEHSVALPEGRWRDLLTGQLDGGRGPARRPARDLPVALLARLDPADPDPADRVRRRRRPGPLRGDVEVGLRPLRGHALEVLDQQLLHRPVAVPLAVGRHDVPGRGLGGAALERRLVGLLVVVPQRALVQVAGVVLPVLVGAVQPVGSRSRCSSRLMCRMTLTTRGAPLDEPLLELVDRGVAVRPRRLRARGRARAPRARPRSATGRRRRSPPAAAAPGGSATGSRGALLVGRLLERGVPHALRVDRADDVPHVPPLPEVSMPCNDEQQRATPATPALGEQPLLQVRRALAHRPRAPPCRPPSCPRSPGVDRGSTPLRSTPRPPPAARARARRGRSGARRAARAPRSSSRLRLEPLDVLAAWVDDHLVCHRPIWQRAPARPPANRCERLGA